MHNECIFWGTIRYRPVRWPGSRVRYLQSTNGGHVMSAEPDAPPYAYAGPETLRAPILAALRRVVDPEVAMTIVDVGLVYGVTVEAGRIHVLLTMTSAAC